MTLASSRCQYARHAEAGRASNNDLTRVPLQLVQDSSTSAAPCGVKQQELAAEKEDRQEDAPRFTMFGIARL